MSGLKYDSFLIIGATDVIEYERYDALSSDRLELYKNLTMFRMIYFDGGFKSPLDIINKCMFDKYYFNSSPEEKREMLNIWNLTTANGTYAINILVEKDIECRIVPNFDNGILQIQSYLSETDNPIIGISSTFVLNWAQIGRISKKIRQLSERAIIVVGGAFINHSYIVEGFNFFPKAIKKYRIDYTLTSANSEIDLERLFSALNGEISVDDINNLIYLADGEVKFTREKRYEPVISLSEKALKAAMDVSYKKTIQLRTGAGCPFSCNFCSYSSMASYKLEDLDKIDKALNQINDSGFIKNIIYIDDNLNVPVSRFNALLSIMQKYEFTWYGFIRAQFINESLAEKMKNCGCDGVYLGLESGSDSVLKLMNKKADTRGYIQGINALKNTGIKTFASFIVGFPGETKKDIEETIDFINNKVSLDFYSLKEWYYDSLSPIVKDAERFNLSGNGEKWTHCTMASYEATEYKQYMYKKIYGASHIDPDLGMWYLAYMRINGFSWVDILLMQTELNKMTDCDLSGNYLSAEKSEAVSKLTTIIKKY